MSDRNLSELEWKKFAKGRNLKDAPLVKALAALETARDGQARLAALDELDKQAEVLRKASKADKEITHYLDELDKSAARERKAAEFDAKKEAAASEDEEDSPAALTTKLLPLLRAVPKGEALQALIAVGAKECAALLSRKPIGPPKRKLLADYLGVASGLKYIAGECVWEANAHTFVVQSEAAGLAKKLKAALFAQAGQRFKVRVRGLDPNDVDDDGEEAGEQEGQEPTSTTSTTASPTATTTTTTTTTTAPQPANDEAARFNTRLAALMPQVREALAGPQGGEVKLKVSEAGALARQHDHGGAHALLDQVEALLQPDPAAAFNTRLAALMPAVKAALAGPRGSEIKLKISEAGVLARKKEFASANALLDEAERLLAGESESTEQQTEERSQPSRSFVDYAKARLAWLDARQQVEADLARLRRAIFEAYAGRPEEAEAQSATKQLDVILRELDEKLADKLDEGLNAAEPAARQRINAQAVDIIGRYQDFIHSSELVREVDDNPFVPVNVQELLLTTLDGLERQLVAA